MSSARTSCNIKVLTHDDWVDLFNVQRPQRLAHRLSSYRHQVFVIGYALYNFTDFSATGRNIVRYPIARKVFGQAAIDTAIEQVRTVMLAWGYSKTRSDGYLTRVMCALFLANRSPQLEDHTTETIALVARRDMPFYEDEYVVVSRVLVHLGVLSHPIAPLHSLQKTKHTPQQVPLVWGEWRQRWRATSTLAASTRQDVYSRLLTVGRWLAQEHPEIESPNQWTPKAKVHLFSTMRMFFRDCQEWDCIPRRFDPARCFATPRSIKALVGPDPRIIADDIWAKLLWAGLNLTAEDLASRSTAPSKPREHRYPLEMVRAIVMV